MTKNNIRIAENITKLRKEKNETQMQLAEAVGVDALLLLQRVQELLSNHELVGRVHVVDELETREESTLVTPCETNP